MISIAKFAMILVVIAALAFSNVLGQATVEMNPAGQNACYCLETLADGLHNPVGVIFYKDMEDDQMLVVEQRGIVYRYEPDGSGKLAFMDITDRLRTSHNYGEARGLLSVVLDPEWDTTRKLYAYYIRKDGDKEYAYVSRFHAEHGVVDHTTETYLLRIYQPYENGNGGPMLFDDDGYLYIVTGDGGEEDDPKGNAQNKNSFHGKVLRIDVRGEPEFTLGESEIAKNYAVPDSNPFLFDNTTKDEIFALGVRNMWGCSIDSSKFQGGTRRIFCAETGTNLFDEINIIEKGRNYGWNIKEGNKCRNNMSSCFIENEGVPIHEFKHNNSHSLVGGYVYRGEAFPWLKGHYIFGDVITGKTYFLKEDNTSMWEDHDWMQCPSDDCPSHAKGKALKHILAFGQDPKGEMYILMTDELRVNASKGSLFKFVVPNSFSSLQVPQPTLTLACAAVLIYLKSFC